MLQKAVEDQSLQRLPCVDVLAIDSYNFLQVEPPDVPDEEKASAIRWQIRDMVDYPIEESVVDYFQVPGDTQRGRADVAYAVCAPVSQLKRQASLLHGARLEVAAMDIPELSLRNIVMLLGEDAKGVAFLYLGRERGVIIVIKEGSLYLARNIHIGLDDLDAGTPEGGRGERSGPEENGPLEEMLGSILLEVQRSLDFYESNFYQMSVGTLVIAPLEQEIPGLEAFLENNLHEVRIRRLALNSLLHCPEIPSQEQGRCLLAIGGALRIEEAGQ